MTNRARIITTNVIDDSYELTSIPVAVPTLPITNIRSPLKSRVARIPTESNGTVRVRGKVTASTVAGFALQGHSLSGSAEFSITLYENDNYTNPLYQMSEPLAVGEISPWGVFTWGSNWGTTQDQRQRNLLIWWFSDSNNRPFNNVRSFEITFTDPGITHIDLGRIYMGDMFSPEISFPAGFSLAWEDLSSQSRTESGSLISDISANYRRLNFSFNYMTESERGLYQDFVARVGKKYDFFVSLFPEEQLSNRELDYSFGCKFTDIPSVVGNMINGYSTDIVVEET